MATYTDSYGFNKGTAAFPAYGDTRISYIEVELDFAAIVAARSAASATALAAADILQVIQVPANAVILHAGFEVTKVESTNTTATFDLGFTGGSPAAANAFGNDVASNALAWSWAAGTGLANPIIIGTSNDTIDLLINTAAPTDCVLRCFAVVLNPN
jgi:hypothetical protein